MKNLIIKSVYLGLILAAYFGVLNLAYDDFFREVLARPHLHPSLLHSVLALSFFCVFVFLVDFPRVARVLDEKKRLGALFAITAALFLFLLYGSFFQTKASYKITALTTLLAFVITLITFCNSKKTSLAWKNLQRGLAAALFLALPLSLAYKSEPLTRYISFRQNVQQISPVESIFNAEERLISTVFLDLHLTEYYLQDRNIARSPLWTQEQTQDPAHFAALDDKNFLLINLVGGIYHLALKQEAMKQESLDKKTGSPGENLHVKELSAVFPINHRELDSSKENKRIIKGWFRVNDLHADVEDGVRTLYVSHHFWNVEKECFTLRITKLIGDASILLENDPSPRWRTLYETAPCFPLFKTNNRFLALHPFIGHQAGGRIVGFDENNLLFAVGDHGFDTFVTPENFPQDPDVSYGKIWKIDRRTGQAELFSLGHRNPQGLYRAPNGTIWETEHGPRGGDELNRITEGDNYGWPHVVYGVQYGHKVWPPGARQNNHDGYEQPVFAWTPSIAVSNLIGVEQDLFPLWKENLLVSSLTAKTLFRLQLHENRVIYSEPIAIGRRIRDLAETPNGEVFLWTDNRRMIRLRPASAVPDKKEVIAEVGERLFLQCLSCHGIEPDAPHGIGPNLHDVYGARIAAKAGYQYSPALKAKSAQRWTRENLSLFLKDPQAFAPGNLMYLKIPDDYERRALLDYLKNSRG